MLSNPDRRQRQDAVRAVGDLSPPHEAVHLLERAAKDRHAAVRETAARELAKTGEPARSMLEQMRVDPNRAVRRAAMEGLKRIDGR
ncbi:MAG: HEAT repeat domain-containing protein [Planctomycetota bacterium]|jgi:HEAT repeat protein